MKLPQLSILIDSKLIEGLSFYLGLIMITLSETAFGLSTNFFGGPPGHINADSSRSADRPTGTRLDFSNFQINI